MFLSVKALFCLKDMVTLQFPLSSNSGTLLSLSSRCAHMSILIVEHGWHEGDVNNKRKLIKRQEVHPCYLLCLGEKVGKDSGKKAILHRDKVSRRLITQCWTKETDGVTWTFQMVHTVALGLIVWVSSWEKPSSQEPKLSFLQGQVFTPKLALTSLLLSKDTELGSFCPFTGVCGEA